MAWDQKAGRLWLDLNRNRDLTDDPRGGVPDARARRRANLHQRASDGPQPAAAPVTLCLDLVIRPQKSRDLDGPARRRGAVWSGNWSWEARRGRWAYSAPFLDFASPVQDGVFMARPWDESLYGAAWPASMPAGMPGFSLRGPEADGVLWAQASKQLHGEHEWTLLGRETETNGPPALALEVRSEARETGVVDVSGSKRHAPDVEARGAALRGALGQEPGPACRGSIHGGRDPDQLRSCPGHGPILLARSRLSKARPNRLNAGPAPDGQGDGHPARGFAPAGLSDG